MNRWILLVFHFVLTQIHAGSLSLSDKLCLLIGKPSASSNPLTCKIESDPEWQKATLSESAYADWQIHEKNKSQNQLKKNSPKRQEIEEFLAASFPEAYQETKNVLYFYGGPDFCYPDLFFPHMENLIIVGQEPIFDLPDVESLYSEGSLTDYIYAIKQSLEDIPFRSYFITDYMNREFEAFGIATILAANIALSDYQLIDIEPIFFPHDLTISALHISYKKWPCDILRHVYYFRFLVSNQLPQDFIRFIERQSIDTAFFKATSFMTQHYQGQAANKLAMKHAKYIIQGESGIPFSYFRNKDWDVDLFGVYTRPYYCSRRNIRPYWGVQNDLKNAYISAIHESGDTISIQLINSIWGQKKIGQSLPFVTWKGLVPMTFDYGGQLARILMPYASTAMQYAKKKKS
jgi:hypothetical protein